jgi:hypothetical protein
MASQKNDEKPGTIVVTPTSAFMIDKDGKRVRISTAQEQKNIENLRKRMRVIQQELDMARLRKEESRSKAKASTKANKARPKRKKK